MSKNSNEAVEIISSLPSLDVIEEERKTLDQLKHIDEETGKEYWYAHDVSKALGYSEFYHFRPAIERAREQMVNNGIDPEEQLQRSLELFTAGNGAVRKVDGYKLTRRGAYTVAMEADPSKPEVAVAQEYFLQKTATAETILPRLKDKLTLDSRKALSLSNKEFSSVCIEHGVETDELGIVHNYCDEGLYDMSTNEIKEKYGKSNKPKADFIGSTMCNAEALAKDLSRISIDSKNAQGVNECSDIAFDTHRAIRNVISDITGGKTPEDLITGEDVKKIENRYNKFTKEQKKAIEQEF